MDSSRGSLYYSPSFGSGCLTGHEMESLFIDGIFECYDSDRFELDLSTHGLSIFQVHYKDGTPIGAISVYPVAYMTSEQPYLRICYQCVYLKDKGFKDTYVNPPNIYGGSDAQVVKDSARIVFNQLLGICRERDRQVLAREAPEPGDENWLI